MMMISLLKKPLKGGIPEMESDAAKEVAEVTGMGEARPPILFRSRVPVACSMAPAFKNSNPLKAAWLMRWKTPPAMASVATSGFTFRAISIIPIPADMMTYPIWLML